MPKQEKIKSVLLTANAEFRVSMQQSLNTLGFTAEKINAEDLAAVGKLVAADRLIWNVVIDVASIFPNESDFKNRFAEIEKVFGNAAVSVLVYLSADGFEAAAATIKDFPRLRVRPLPARRQDVVDDFVKPFRVRHGLEKGAKPPQKATAPAQGESITEAIEQVRQTIDWLKLVASDTTAITQFIAIGQRFNGLYGAYLFLNGRDGYHQMRLLCEVIDALSKTYAKSPEKSNLAQPHVELMIRGAKCVFAILKEMRGGKALSQVLKDETDAVRKAYDAMTDVFRRDAMSQEFVDEIMQKHSA